MFHSTLGVNVDHVATVREARRITYPDPLDAALLSEKAGCHGITVHLREDRRHIQEHDVYRLRENISTHLNLELAVDAQVVAIALDVKPDYVTFVPEKREEVTTEGGLDLSSVQGFSSIIDSFKKLAIDVSLFIDPDFKQVDMSCDLGADAIEIHTGCLCRCSFKRRTISRVATHNRDCELCASKRIDC